MTVYYWTMIAVVFLASMAERTVAVKRMGETERYRYKSTFFLILTALVLATVSGLRYRVGTDYMSYYNGYLRYADKLEASLASFEEPGLPIIASILSKFTDDAAYFMFACALITMVLICQNTYKYTKDFVYASILIILMGIWTGSFNGLRQYLAAAIVFSGYGFVRRRELMKYLAVVLIASAFHISAIVMVVPYFLLTRKITGKNLLILAVGTMLLSVAYERLFELVSQLKGTEMNIEDAAYYGTTVNIFRVLSKVAPAVFAIYLYRNGNLTKEQTFYINVLVINAAAMVATMNSAYLARLSIYTEICMPLAVTKLVCFKNKKNQREIRGIILALYFVFWYIEVSRSGALNNFHWIWERNPAIAY